jgi:hypothetical protein
VYDSGNLAYQLYQPLLRNNMCGTQNCFGAVSDSSLSFDAASEDFATWPLRAGTYKAWMFRKGPSGGPFFGYGATQVFTVADSC